MNEESTAVDTMHFAEVMVTRQNKMARAQAPTKSERGGGQREEGGKGVLAGWLVEVWGMVGGGEIIQRGL